MRILLTLFLVLLSVLGPAWSQGSWHLSDTRVEIVKDSSNSPGEWVAGGSSAALKKRWYNPNAGKNFVISATFEWKGIPLTLASDQDYQVSLVLDQQANSETGYDPSVKVYAGEKGGVEADGPSLAASWRNPVSRQQSSGVLRAPRVKPGSSYILRVQCKAAGDYYHVYYTYLPQASRSLTGNWAGTWSNTVGETGPDQLSLQEDSSGNLSGTWSGNIAVRGRRLSANQIELSGANPTRAFTIRGEVRGQELILRYTARRLNAPGSYTGESRFRLP